MHLNQLVTAADGNCDVPEISLLGPMEQDPIKIKQPDRPMSGR